MDFPVAVRKRLRIDLCQVQREAFNLYLELLLEGRHKANLTSLRDKQSIERRLFLESAALLGALSEAGVVSSPVIDIGSGAGIPGIPFKILRPELQVTLVEAIGKKARFLEDAVGRLGLEGVDVKQTRAEELAREPAHREKYALAVARAVAPLRILAELALPFVRLGGYLAAPKGSGAAREVREAERALQECGGAVQEVRSLDVGAPGPSPTLVLIRKVAPTPDRYPRRPGIPRKRPL